MTNQTTTINGFACKDCTDIDYAKKHIDPAHPKDGPYGINKPKETSKAVGAKTPKDPNDPAVLYAGAVTGPGAIDPASRAASRPVQVEGGNLDITG